MLSSGQLLAVACTDRRIQLWRVSADEVGLVLAFPRILFNGSQFFLVFSSAEPRRPFRLGPLLGLHRR